MNNRIIKLVLALIVAIGLGVLVFYFVAKHNQRPILTVIGWRAIVNTIAGDGTPGSGDGPAANAHFSDVFGVARDQAGNLFFSDAGENNRICKLTIEGQVITLAGGREGFADGTGTAASFNTPSAIALDSDGNIYVADTGNNAIRKVSAQGVVTTISGGGAAAYHDGTGTSARFNGPVGVAVDSQNNLFVADTYNDRIRRITPDGQVTTIAGGNRPGYSDGRSDESLFDTPSGIASDGKGNLFVADTGNSAVRKISSDGQVTTITRADSAGGPTLRSPIALALTHDGFIYATENSRGRVMQISPDGAVREIMLAGGTDQRLWLNRPSGVVIGAKGELYVAETGSYALRKLSPPVEEGKLANSNGEAELFPKLTPETLKITSMPWPVDPQFQWHEVTGDLGEVRGTYEGENRDHIHSGIDVQGGYGTTARSVYDEKVSGPSTNWGFGALGEGMHVDVMTYIHIRVGRDQQDRPFNDPRFIFVNDEQGKLYRVRIRRGARFRVGDALGTLNRMYHVHLNFGPWGAEYNPMALPFIGLADHIPPTIERDGIQLIDQAGQRLTEKIKGKLVVRGPVNIVVDAYDQLDGNLARRKLGLYRVGYQILRPDGAPAPGFEEPRMNLRFDRVPAGQDSVRLAYADSSGITVYGSPVTHFYYMVTNTVHDSVAERGSWDTALLPPGDYVLRIIAFDYAGNEAKAGRDLPVTIQQ